MKELVKHADIITPNLTEACILTETHYRERWSRRELQELTEKLAALGPEKIVLTGVPQGVYVANYCYEAGKEPAVIRTRRAGVPRCGTGDIFAAVIAADAVNGVDFRESVRKAARFIRKCILRSVELEIPLTDGVCFEEVLDQLK